MARTRANATGGDAARIFADLQALAADRVFDLSDELGASAIDATRAGIAAAFDHEVDADGVPWPELAPATAREKARHWPGKPILVRTGLLRDGVPGSETIAPDSAVYTFGGITPGDQEEADYAEQGDPLANRPPRRFVDLTPESTAEVDQLFDRAFEQRTPG